MIATHDEETIIAQCTPKGAGALALLRLSGVSAIEIADGLSKLPSGAKLSEQSTHTIHYGWVIDHTTIPIDQVLFLLMRAPKTFTGQDTVEISCHNNPFIIEAIIEQAILHGARLAQEGEFTKRAVLSGKIDLIQAEAINELINANTSVALKQSLAQLSGSLSGWIAAIERDLIKAIALCEASFEFIDEEMTFGTQIATIVRDVLERVATIKKQFDQQKHIRHGIRIAIIGTVNAGKSSLFNALVGDNRAIVTSIAGTTRDVIEAGLYKNGNYWTLVDTAGLRQTDDIIEQEGIARSFDECKKADVIVLVFDGSQSITLAQQKVYQELAEQYRSKIIPVINKIDLPRVYNTADQSIAVSTKDTSTINTLFTVIQNRIDNLLSSADSPFLLNRRQFNEILALEQKLLPIVHQLQLNIQYELVSYHLNDALAHTAHLTGKTISEQSMDAVFREFCIGK